jgi:erythromycin esterase
MAENFNWVTGVRSNKKTILWAHNLHIAKDVTKNSNYPVGYYLAEKYKQDYYAIGFGFSSGKLRAFDMKERKVVIYDIPPVQITNSSDYYFSQANTPNFILDFKTATSDPILASFLNQKMNSRAIGGGYDPEKQAQGAGGAYQKLLRLYDAIIFFKETNAVTPVN